MSKYNLIDIYEQYQIGSGFTRDFDYAGMLNAGLKTGVDTDIEILRKMSDDFEDVNYHRENNHLQMAIDALEEGAIKEASMFFGDFHAEIKSTMETFGMDIEPTLGKFMASKMEENEAVDLAIEASQEKAGIKENEDMYDVVDKASGEMIDDDLPKRMALALAAKKKGWVTKKSQKKAGIKENKALNMTASAETLRKIIFKLLDDGQIQPETADDILNAISNSPSDNVYEAKDKKDKDKEPRDGVKSAASKLGMKPSHIKEVRIDREVAERIEGMLSIPLKRKFLDSFMDLWQDLIEEDPFYAEDVINHLNNEMHKEIDGYQAMGDRLAGLEEGYEDTKGKALYPILKAGANATGDEVEMYVKSLAKDIELNGKEQYSDFTSDDFVEDFKNYIADKSLQEHFKRFM
jgi:hypothetical protein